MTAVDEEISGNIATISRCVMVNHEVNLNDLVCRNCCGSRCIIANEFASRVSILERQLQLAVF